MGGGRQAMGEGVGFGRGGCSIEVGFAIVLVLAHEALTESIFGVEGFFVAVEGPACAVHEAGEED